MINNITIDPKLHIAKLDEIYKQPITIRVNKFDEEYCATFHKDFEEAINTGQSVLPILIDSFGGSSYGVIGMLNLIEQSPIPVATILLSKAMSAGAILFAFGTDGYRYMHPDASLMIHDMACVTGGKVEDIKADSKSMDELNQRIYKRMSVHLGHKPDYFGNLIKEHNHVDWHLTAKDAKKHNIANHLKVPKYNIQIGLNVSFG